MDDNTTTTTTTRTDIDIDSDFANRLRAAVGDVDDTTEAGTTSRRSFLKNTALAAGAGAGLLAGATGTAAAKKRSNARVRQMVDLDFYVWNNRHASTGLLRDVYFPTFHRHATTFGGPSFAGVALILSGGRRPYITLFEYRRMVELMRESAETNGQHLIYQRDSWVQRNNPRSGGEWTMTGLINKTPFRQDGEGVHYWKAGKIHRVYVRGFDFADLLRQIV